MRSMFIAAILAALTQVPFSGAVYAQSECTSITDSTTRLACYDGIFGMPPPQLPAAPVSAFPVYDFPRHCSPIYDRARERECTAILAEQYGNFVLHCENVFTPALKSSTGSDERTKRCVVEMTDMPQREVMPLFRVIITPDGRENFQHAYYDTMCSAPKISVGGNVARGDKITALRQGGLAKIQGYADWPGCGHSTIDVDLNGFNEAVDRAKAVVGSL